MPTHSPPDPANPASDRRWSASLTHACELLPSLLACSLPSETARRADILLGLCHVLAFRADTGARLSLIGVLGNADSGKSTLLGSVAGADISRVTPIPHQTTGAILAAPFGCEPEVEHPSFLRPVAAQVDLLPEGTTGLSGAPDIAHVVPSWERDTAPFFLIDLPDFGTVDAHEERQVALRMIPWLDRVILMLTEETFAQADHEEIDKAFALLQPDRAQPELYVALNRRHERTTDPAFASRLEKVRSLWPQGTVFTLPHLTAGERFSPAHTLPLVAESTPRVTRILRSALKHLADEVAGDVRAVSDLRQEQARILHESVQRAIREESRFSPALLTDEFRRRLDAFSPWQTSLRRLRHWMGRGKRPEPPLVDLMSEEAVGRHLLEAATRLQQRVERKLERIAPDVSRAGDAPTLPPLNESQIAEEASRLVRETNRRARKDVERLLESLQEGHRFKDPVLRTVATVASALFLFDLVVPSVGTLSTITLSGILSALGVGGVFTADALRKIRSSRLRESFESGMARVLSMAASGILEAGSRQAVGDLPALSRRLSRWRQDLPEV